MNMDGCADRRRGNTIMPIECRVTILLERKSGIHFKKREREGG
jgi:hypothetical protein